MLSRVLQITKHSTCLLCERVENDEREIPFNFSRKRENSFVPEQSGYFDTRRVPLTVTEALWPEASPASRTGRGEASTEILSVPRKFREWAGHTGRH